MAGMDPMNPYPLVDFHTHLLPGMDDGAADDRQCRALAEALAAQGARKVVCTPHFYPSEESFETFAKRRDRCFQRLLSLCGDIQDIEWIPGAEVYCDGPLAYMSRLPDLGIGGASCILVELPYDRPVTDATRKILHTITDRYSMTPVIAHAERYWSAPLAPLRTVRTLRDLGCAIQVNADSFLDKELSGRVLAMVRSDLVDIIGSDCHDPVRRPPRMREALERIRETFGEGKAGEWMKNAERLLSPRASGEGDLFF